MIGIYGIFKKHSNECYIGKSIKIESRFEEHKKHTHQRIWVNNDVIEKAIYTSELDSYILEGFHRGRLSRPRSKRKSQGATTIESVSRS